MVSCGGEIWCSVAWVLHDPWVVGHCYWVIVGEWVMVHMYMCDGEYIVHGVCMVVVLCGTLVNWWCMALGEYGWWCVVVHAWVHGAGWWC